MTSAATSGSKPADQPEQPGAIAPYYGALVFGVGFAVRLWLIRAFPVIFGGDSVVRLANQDRILLSYQLPLLQTIVHYLSAVSSDPLLIRYFMALAGAAAGLAFYALASSLLGRTAGFHTALLFATSPFVIAFSIVPYQEILMLAGLFAAFYFAFEHRWPAASLCLGLACLTRYEAWLACPVLAAAFLVEKNVRPLQILKASLLFGWAPLGWIAFHGAVTPPGTFAAEAAFSLERFFRYAYLAWITVKNTPLPVLVLALYGAWICARRGLLRQRHYQMLLAFLVLFLAAVLVSAHGERDQPERFVTAREAHIPLAAVVFAAGIGLRAVPRFRWTIVVLSGLAGLWMAHRFVTNETSQPPFALSYQAARYLDQHVDGGEQVVVLAQPVPEDLLSRYLEKAEQSGGAEGRSQAIRLLLDLDASPPNYQRILVQSRLGKDQLKNVSRLPPDLVPPGNQAARASITPAWVVLWSDFVSTNDAEEALRSRVAGESPERTFEQDGLRVSIYRLE